MEKLKSTKNERRMRPINILECCLTIPSWRWQRGFPDVGGMGDGFCSAILPSQLQNRAFIQIQSKKE